MEERASAYRHVEARWRRVTSECDRELLATAAARVVADRP
jgi:hypothetical protein